MKEYYIENEQEYKQLKQDLINKNGTVEYNNKIYYKTKWTPKTTKSFDLIKYCKDNNIKIYFLGETGPREPNTAIIYIDSQ